LSIQFAKQAAGNEYRPSLTQITSHFTQLWAAFCNVDFFIWKKWKSLIESCSGIDSCLQMADGNGQSQQYNNGHSAVRLFSFLALLSNSGFGDLELACWFWYPNSRVRTQPMPSEILGRKIPQQAFLRSGSKDVGSMS
jgi:hypothetical protein